MLLLDGCATKFKFCISASTKLLSGIRCLNSLSKVLCSGKDLVKVGRGLHYSAALCKYHDLKKARTLVKRKMNMLQARLDRLDKEDRPSGCILCPMRNDIEIDYKNVRLLSQFISPHTGRIYGQALTGLCEKKQKEVARAIRRSRALGFMPTTMKYYEFHNDPKIF